MAPDNFGLDHRTGIEVVAGFLAFIALCQVFTGFAFDRLGFVRRKDQPGIYWLIICFWAGGAAAVYFFAQAI